MAGAIRAVGPMGVTLAGEFLAGGAFHACARRSHDRRPAVENHFEQPGPPPLATTGRARPARRSKGGVAAETATCPRRGHTMRNSSPARPTLRLAWAAFVSSQSGRGPGYQILTDRLRAAGWTNLDWPRGCALIWTRAVARPPFDVGSRFEGLSDEADNSLVSAVRALRAAPSQHTTRAGLRVRGARRSEGVGQHVRPRDPET